jgi:hypothetical protein
MLEQLNQGGTKVTALTVMGHFLLVTIAFLVCAQVLPGMELPDSYNLLTWDANWYDSIRKSGYVFIPDSVCNMAFFPLFPLVWDLLKVDAVLISIINAVLFMVSFILLMGRKNQSVFYLLALISIPSFVFFFVPFSESLFFLFGTLFLLGYESSNKWLIVIGLAGACLTRSVAMIFIPALIFTQLICGEWNRKNIMDILLYTTAPLCSIAVVVFWQYFETGKWFYFIEVQQYWNRYPHVPELPFEVLSAGRIARFDATALLIGFIAAYFCITWGINTLWAKYRKIPNPTAVPPGVVFSALYLAGATFTNIFFSFELDAGSVLMSLNRYIFATPFFICFIRWLATEYAPPRHVIIGIVVLTAATFLSTALWQQSVSVMYYFVAFAMIYPLGSLLKKGSVPAYLMIYALNITFQIMLFNDLLHKKWVG